MRVRSKRSVPEVDQGRQVHRSFHASYLERVRGYHQTEAYQKTMNKRKVWVEPLFAEAKDWQQARQETRQSHLEQLNRSRFCRRPLVYLATLEARWEQTCGT